MRTAKRTYKGSKFLMNKLVFYEMYHQKKWNKIVHGICIPLMIWSLLTYLHSIKTTKGVDLAVVWTMLYASGCTYFEIDAGMSWALCVGLPLYLLAKEIHVVSEYPLRWAGLGLVLGLWIQLHVGHVMIEKKRPAFFDGFVEAIAIAPFFVWLELLFAFGYRPEMYNHMKREASKRLKAMKKI